jgi:hypothetical protein
VEIQSFSFFIFKCRRVSYAALMTTPSSIFFPHEISKDNERFNQVHYKSGVFIVAKAVSVRYYNTNMRKGGGSGLQATKRTQVMLCDGQGMSSSLLQVVFMNTRTNATEILGKIVCVGPVDVVPKNPAYDSCAGDFTAFARSSPVATSFAVLGEREFRERVPKEEARERMENVSFVPSISTVVDTRRGGNGRCVNVTVVIDAVERCETSGDVLAKVHDDTAACDVVISAPPADSRDEFHTHRLFADKLLSYSIGEVIVLMDFVSSVQLSGDVGPRAVLKSGATSSLNVIRSESVRDRLTKSIVPGDYVDAVMRADELVRVFPPVDDLIKQAPGEVTGKTLSVIGKIDRVTSSQYSRNYTRLKCSKDFRHSDFQEEDGDDEGGKKYTCLTCGPFSEATVDRTFDVTTMFKESENNDDGSVCLKWSSNAATSLFGMTPASFSAMDDQSVKETVDRTIGKFVAMRVWCKEGGWLVMEAAVVHIDEGDASFDAVNGSRKRTAVDDEDTPIVSGGEKKVRKKSDMLLGL